MRPRAALRLACRDFYANSWRFVVLNAALGVVLVAVALAAAAFPPAVVLLVLAGPVAAALVHCAVTLVQTGDMTLGEAAHGFRVHWRRGLLLGAAGAAIVALGALAVVFYGRTSLWPLAFLTLYVLLLLAIFGLVLWTHAIEAPGTRLPVVAREAVAIVLARPLQTLALGLVLALLNALAIAAALMPFLTLSIAFTFLAVAHHTVNPQPLESA
jgi:hypothetical protein